MPDNNIMPAAPAGNAGERVRRLLADRDTLGTTLLVLCVDTWGTECLQAADDPARGPWHPAVFRDEIQHRFGVALPKCNLDKLMAAVVVVTTDLFFKSLPAFVTLANVMCGDEFSPEVWEKADSVECAWAVTEALLLDPPDEADPAPFCDDVRHYIGAVLRDEGYVTPPDVLRIAIDGDFADKVRYAFADDPEMFEGIYAVQRDRAAEVEAALREQLLDLRSQLEALPLTRGDAGELVKRIDQMIRLNAPAEAEGPESLV